MFGVATGRKRVRLRIIDQIDARHWQASAGAELAHEPYELGRGPFVYLVSSIFGEHDLIGIPVTEKVRGPRDHESDHHSTLTADQVPDCHQ